MTFHDHVMTWHGRTIIEWSLETSTWVIGNILPSLSLDLSHAKSKENWSRKGVPWDFPAHLYLKGKSDSGFLGFNGLGLEAGREKVSQ